MKLKPSVSDAIGILIRVNELGPRVSAVQIAEGCGFAPRFLYRVLRGLVQAGLLESNVGPGGGYTLTRDLARISLLDAVRAVDSLEPTNLDACCPRQRKATNAVSRVCAQAAKRFERDLANTSLGDLANIR